MRFRVPFCIRPPFSPHTAHVCHRTGSSSDTLDMANPENLVILKILVQTDAVRFGVPFYIHLLFSYHAPFLPHTVRMCYCCTCARPAHLNISIGRYNEFLSKTSHNDFLKNSQQITSSQFQKMQPRTPQIANFR